MKKLAYTILCSSFIVFSTTTIEAHTIYEKNPEILKTAENTLKTTDEYMKNNYSLSLTDNLTIINTYDYKTDINKFHLEDNKYAIEHSAAVSIPGRNTIILNMNIITPEAYSFFLTHELIHKYQTIQANKNRETINNHIGLTEGIADIIAEKLTGITLSSKDQNIPFESLQTMTDFQTANKNYNETTVYEQCRYYAGKYLKENPTKLYY